MKLLKIVVLLFFLAILVLPMVKTRSVQGQSPSPSADFTTAPGSVDDDPALDANRVQVPPDGATPNVAPADTADATSDRMTLAAITPAPACLLKEAPTGFDDKTNNFVTQPVHDADLDGFQEVDFITNGLGPVYNAQACSECHQSPVTGGISQITELRAGHLVNGNFVPADVTITNDSGNGTVTIFGRSLINDRTVCPAVHSNIVANPNPPPGFPAIFRAFNLPFANAEEHVPEDVTGAQLITT